MKTFISLYGVPFNRVRIIHNGIDLDEYKPTRNPAVLAKYGIDPDRPFVLFVGRITRQKGIIHLVDAVKNIRPGVQVVLAQGRQTRRKSAARWKSGLSKPGATPRCPSSGLPRSCPGKKIIPLDSHASVFICPSVYEPFGIINLEAMACETPVVASAVGGIKEVVIPGETGLLVPFEARSGTDFEPRDPARFALDLAKGANELLADPGRLRAMGLESQPPRRAFL